MMADPVDEMAIAHACMAFAGPISFLKSAPSLQFLPDAAVPEVAFAGLSNVGKSSLLNALTGRKALARTSVTPGRTQELNFFDVGTPLAFRLVDMPGYGFAKAPKDVVKKWRYLINDFLRGRAVLRSEEHTSELQSLMRISYAVFCLKKNPPDDESLQ